MGIEYSYMYSYIFIEYCYIGIGIENAQRYPTMRMPPTTLSASG